MEKWKLKNQNGYAVHFEDMDKTTVYYNEDKDEDVVFFKFICPICGKHEVGLVGKRDYPKSKWWTRDKEGSCYWEFGENEDGSPKINPSVQLNSDCKGHFWFKQGSPRKM